MRARKIIWGAIGALVLIVALVLVRQGSGSGDRAPGDTLCMAAKLGLPCK